MRLSRSIGSFTHRKCQEIKTRAKFWKLLFAITALASFIYVFMEWLFFVTMPSFMSLMSFPDMVEIFLLAGLALTLLSLVLLIAFIFLHILALALQVSRFTSYLGAIIPTVILSALVLLLIDNFTYTVFKFGISTSVGIWRGAYALLLLVIFGFIGYRMLKSLAYEAELIPMDAG